VTGRLNRASGLFAQPMMLRLLDHEAAQALRHNTPLTVVRLSLELNESLEEAAARRAHQALAQILNTQLRAVDLPGHLEDEYLLVLPITTETGGRVMARRLAASVASLDPAPVPALAVCAGLASHPGGPGCNGNLLADHATAAQRAAQERGPHNVLSYSDLDGA
jgi:GGDEF domain-containing protein